MNLLSLVRRSDSGQDAGQKNWNKDTTTTEDIQMDYGMVTGNISSMPSVKKLVVETALNKLFTKEWFDVCTLDSILKVMDISRETEAYKQLSALHCVHYNRMSPEMKQVLPMLVNEALRLPVINVATQEALKGVQF